MYINCHSYFSFRFGTLSVKGLVDEALEKGIDTLCLTDINNTSAVFDFIGACHKKEIKPVIGIDFRNEDCQLYIGIARNMRGFRELNIFLTPFLHEKRPLPETAPYFENCYIIYPFGKKRADQLRENEYIGIKPGEVRRLSTSTLQGHREKLVVLQPVTFKNKKGFNVHRLLRAIDKNTLLSKIGPDDHAAADEVMLPLNELTGHFAAYPQIISNTLRMLDHCHIEFDFRSTKNRKTFTGSIGNDFLLLRKLAYDGLSQRYGHENSAAEKQVNRELKIIHELGFSAYFLITWDIVKYARNRGFRSVGRGSGANSIVAYCLRLTDVDPIELDLYFERFINRYRSSPPDFDIDFSWDERDEVTDYIFKRYGKDHTALLATYNTFKGKSIIRELGKVFGLPKPEIDKLVSEPGNILNHDHITDLIFTYGKMIENFPNHLSIHAGGILISEEPIYQYTATELPPKGFPTTQFDMFVADDISFHKYDILSQRGLGHMKDAVRLIHENQGIRIQIDEVEKFKRDPKLNDLLKAGKTIGCFYIESPAMRQLLRKLKCDNYLTLVAASSVIRPGVAKSGMMGEYIYRHHHPDRFQYIHPKMKELLQETYGVMVYQEDVIKVAHHFAGLDLGKADVLRRAMSRKYRSNDGFERIRKAFFKNCDEKNYPRKISQEVWRQMESFSGYSFPKAHSASFAVESYQSLFLKAYYPKEFMVAVINNFGGFYRTALYVNEAINSGAEVLPPCVNTSEYLTNIHGDRIYLGFVHIKSLERAVARELILERERNGPYQSLSELCERIRISLEQTTILIRVGALRFTGKTKKELLWESTMMLKNKKDEAKAAVLFKTAMKAFRLPDLQSHWLEDTYDEIELLGFPLCNPFDLVEEDLSDTILSDDLASYVNKTVRIAGYLTCTKHVQTVNRKIMYFANYTDKKRQMFDTVHFPPSIARYPLRGKGAYLIEGKVTEEYGVYAIEVRKLEKLSYKKDPRFMD